MIKNERQYRITRAQLERFDRAAANLANEPAPADVHPLLRDAERKALESQLSELRRDVAEYEALRAGDRTVLKLDSIDELSQGLIRARIATGVTHKELAERLAVPEQQIQRYEATDYSTLTLPRLAEVARALGLSVREDIFLPNAKVSTETLLQRLGRLGLDRQFVMHRLGPGGPPGTSAEVEPDDSRALRMAAAAQRVFGIAPEDIFSARPLDLPTQPVLAARFKKAARSDRKRADAYTVYAHYIALVVHQATPSVRLQRISADVDETRRAIATQHGQITFESVLRYAWSAGIAVVPLADPGAFHGAMWRVDGRNIVVIKQKTTSLARWTFDLLHEIFHAAQEPEADERSVLEEAEDSEDRWGLVEEQHAMQFAGDVSLQGKAHLLAEECVAAVKGSVERLKAAVPRVAARHGVDAGSLANYIAFRLSNQTPRINWWGAATNLQNEDEDPVRIARDVLFEHAQLARVNEIDRRLLIQAMNDPNE